MSNSLVRKSLDIVGADDELKRGKNVAREISITSLI